MDPFFLYVSIGALVLLIVILIIIGVTMTQLRSLDPFPPTMNACPDYWDVSSNPQYCGVPTDSNKKNFGNMVISSNNSNSIIEQSRKENIGMCAGSDFGCSTSTTTYFDVKSKGNNDNFQYVKLNGNNNWTTMYPGISERCAQKKWAQTMGISWDGVTNYNGC